MSRAIKQYYLPPEISTTSISIGRSATTSSISVTATIIGGGTLTYSWQSSGNACTINTPASSSTTLTGGGIVGSSLLFCNITNSLTGIKYQTPTCSISWVATAPDPPTIGASSFGDKSLTINWTAPADDGGSAITGYYIQIKKGSDPWQTPVLVGNVLTYTFSGNTIIYNGFSYIAKVAAVNNIDTGTYSGDSAGVIPTFAAPTIQSINLITPSTSLPYIRPFTITFTPTSCVDYAYTLIYVQNTTLESPFINGFYRDVNNVYNNDLVTRTNTTGQQTCPTITNIYANTFASGIGFFNCGTSSFFSAYVITYNNDNWPVQSAIFVSQESSPTLSYYTYNPDPVNTSNALSLYTGGQFNVNSGTYSVVSGSITSNDWNIVKLNVSARTAVQSSSYGITSASRYFLLDYSFTTPSTYTQVFNGNSSPFNAAGSAIGTRNTDVDISDTLFDNNGNGKIRVRGVGTFTTNTTIQVNVTAFGQTRTINYY